MKNASYLWTILIVLGLCACKATVKEEKVEEPIPSASMKVMLVRHPVKDYDAWLPHFKAHDSVRLANGIHTLSVGRTMDDPNMVLLSFRVDDVEKARNFTMMPELKAIMDSAGVSGPPTFEYLDVVRLDSSDMTTKDRVIVSHRVKDYDAWLKVYDAEGRTARSAHGVTDRALARSLDDPNKVYILFNLKDREKFTARIGSEELKKLMTEAGVEGQPEATMYTVQNWK